MKDGGGDGGRGGGVGERGRRTSGGESRVLSPGEEGSGARARLQPFRGFF